VFVESSVPHRYIEALQEAVEARGFRVKIGGSLFSDAMGDPGSPEGTYNGMVRHNIDVIVSALSGARSAGIGTFSEGSGNAVH
jgi:manganese/zinc/iron transport system substrate-binding protein